MATTTTSTRARKPAPAAKKAAAPVPAPKAPKAKKKSAAPAVEAKAPRGEKEKKPKLVRDSFTIPKAEYAVLDELKQRAARLGQPAKKSELLRAGVMALAAMRDAAFPAQLDGVPAVKTGRPPKA
ncbi:hypothetical protein HK414_12575 [Ramlibacter terrae]|uniref:Uncharacterized protein n=1 Tax=Ramlibacter terrae TaxID=2732511 RepID=A0ABX6P6V6_9BURK|nr:hypothetical protein HK414_12575 [Ramlibacter terrae]